MPYPMAAARGRGAMLSAPSYIAKVLALGPFAYYPMNEPSGTTADNAEGTAARDGTYSGVTLGQTGIGDGNTCPLFDGVNDYCNVYSASFDTAFDETQGTVALWLRMFSATEWTDGVQRYGCNFRADANNILRIYKSANNTVAAEYLAASVSKIVAATISTTAWFHVACTWSGPLLANEFKFYVNGAQSGSTQTLLGTWVGALNSAFCVVGARTNAGLNPWYGYSAHPAMWNTVLGSAQIATLAVV